MKINNWINTVADKISHVPCSSSVDFVLWPVQLTFISQLQRQISRFCLINYEVKINNLVLLMSSRYLLQWSFSLTFVFVCVYYVLEMCIIAVLLLSGEISSFYLENVTAIVSLPVGQLPVLKLLSRPFWGLLPHRGNTIHGLAWNVAQRMGLCQISRSEADIWGFLPPKQKNCQLIRLARVNPLPDVGEICRVYVGNRSTEVVNIWCDSVGKLGIYRQKPSWGIFSQNFFIFVQSLVEIRCCMAAWERKVRSYCFFVCHALDLELE